VPITARPVGWLESRWRWCRRNPIVAGLTAAVVVLLFAAAVGSTWALLVIARDRRAVAAARDEAEGHLADALDARNREEGQRRRAEGLVETTRVQAEQRRDLLARAHVSTGVRLLDEGDYLRSLVYFGAALEQDQGDARREERHRVRLAVVRRHCPRLVHAWVHDEPVANADYNANKTRLVTVSGKTVRVFDTATGEQVHAPIHLEGQPMGAGLVPGDDRLLVALGSECRVLDVKTGKVVVPVMRHASRVSYVAFREDGRRLLTMCDDGVARVWDPATGEAVTPPMRHTGIILQGSFSPDGKRVVTGSNDHTARVWDAQTGQPVTPPLQHGAVMNATKFSPDGKRVATANHDGTAQVWDAATGKPALPALRHTQAVFDVAFSPDGRLLATGSADHTARVWDGRTGQPLLAPLEHPTIVEMLSFRPDGAILATVSGPRVYLWNPATGQQVLPPLEHARDVWWVEFTPDGRNLFTVARDHTVRRWDLAVEPSTPTRLDAALKCPRAPPSLAWPQAVVRLQMDDRAGYQKSCAFLLARLGKTTNPDLAHTVAWTCALAPGAATDLSVAVARGRAAAAADPRNFARVRSYGAILYRAGKYEEARKQLQSALALQPRTPMTWLFLALTHARLGEPAEAKKWLDQAGKWMEQSRAARPEARPKEVVAWDRLGWTDRVALTLLKREADELLLPAKKKAAPAEPGKP
jgi:WD40 repeat protein